MPHWADYLTFYLRQEFVPTSSLVDQGDLVWAEWAPREAREKGPKGQESWTQMEVPGEEGVWKLVDIRETLEIRGGR